MQGVITNIAAEWDRDSMTLKWSWIIIADDEIAAKGIEDTREGAVDRVSELLAVDHG